MDGTVKVEGLRELRDALTRLIPAEMQGKTLQKALSAGIKPMVATARAMAPKREGVLRRAIQAVRSKRNSNGVYEERIMRVRHGKKQQKKNRDAFYWRFIEFGRGEVTAKKGTRSLGTPKDGFFGRTVKAAPAKPFMRPAFEANKVGAVGLIADALRKSLSEAARKASWRIP